MVLSTTFSIEGREVEKYIGIVGAEVIFGSTFVRDWLAQGTDLIGGRSKEYEDVYQSAREKALDALANKARTRGANAVIGVKLDYQVLGANNGMLMVAATGTAVVLAMPSEMREAIARAEVEDEPLYTVQINGAERGPFSIAQLRELKERGALNELALARADGKPDRTLGALLMR